MLFFHETYERVFDFTEGPPLHDPCAVAFVIAPNIFNVKVRSFILLASGKTRNEKKKKKDTQKI